MYLKDCIDEIQNRLQISKETESMILYQPFSYTFDNINKYPFEELKEDKIYYKMLEGNLDLLLKDYFQGWIKSERQLVFIHPACISFVQFILNNQKEIENIQIVCRSTNLKQMQSDVQFFVNFVKNVNFVPFSKNISLTFSWNMPHEIKTHWNKIYEKEGKSKI